MEFQSPSTSDVSESENHPIAPSARAVHSRTLGAWSLCFIAYFNVCGGPWGSESTWSTCGPLPAFLGIVLFTFCWAMPVILVTSELSSTFPEDGGYSIWVKEAFGDFWGFVEFYVSWTSGVVDNALYPVLAYNTFKHLLGGIWSKPLPDVSSTEDHSWQAYVAKLAIMVAFTLPNLLSNRVVAASLGIACVIVMVPCLVLGIVGTMSIPDLDGISNLLASRENLTMTDWTTLATCLYWNLNGFDCTSTCAGEVKNPGRNYIRGLLASLMLVLLTYFGTFLGPVASGASSWREWEEGSLTTIAEKQAGPLLAICIGIACFVGNFGQYSAELFEDSWQIAGMADRGLVPRWLGLRSSQFGTPVFAIVMQMALMSILISFDFLSILAVDNLFSAIGSLLELAAFYQLRVSHRYFDRPFKVPIDSSVFLVFFLVPPVLIGLLVVASSLCTCGPSALTVNLFLAVAGPAMYASRQKYLDG